MSNAVTLSLTIDGTTVVRAAAIRDGYLTGPVGAQSYLALALEIVAGRLLAPYVGVSLDTYTGIILIHALINLPLGVLLLKSFFDDIPREIDESALIDGADQSGTRWSAMTCPPVRRLLMKPSS